MIGGYAEVVWFPEDIRKAFPQMSFEQAEEWLERNEDHLQTRLTELGWEVIASIGPQLSNAKKGE